MDFAETECVVKSLNLDDKKSSPRQSRYARQQNRCASYSCLCDCLSLREHVSGNACSSFSEFKRYQTFESEVEAKTMLFRPGLKARGETDSHTGKQAVVTAVPVLRASYLHL